MRIARTFVLFCFLIFFAFTPGCASSGSEKMHPSNNLHRRDGAYKIEISKSGSLQNPAFSPDGESGLFTRFRSGYNKGHADLFIVGLEKKYIHTLVSDGSENVNLPGSSWNQVTQQIVFSSSREPHDEIFIIDEDGNPGDETRITNRNDKVAYEPSFAPDGKWIVFESHQLDVEENGVIAKYKIDGKEPLQTLTDLDDDCRQPNWSPQGDSIIYQKYSNGRWDIWIMKIDGTNKRKITEGKGDKTDASFSSDGKQIIYSSDEGRLEFANLFMLPVRGGKSKRITNYDGYDGAPSWSPDGNRIIFESCPGDPDRSKATSIWVIDVPEK